MAHQPADLNRILSLLEAGTISEATANRMIDRLPENQAQAQPAAAQQRQDRSNVPAVQQTAPSMGQMFAQQARQREEEAIATAFDNLAKKAGEQSARARYPGLFVASDDTPAATAPTATRKVKVIVGEKKRLFGTDYEVEEIDIPDTSAAQQPNNAGQILIPPATRTR